MRCGEIVPSFRYRALTQAGEVVSGSISAPTAAEVVRQVEYLGLVPIDAVSERDGAEASGFSLDFLTKPSAEDITIFTRDLALLLKSGARIDAALDLLATDMDIGRLRPDRREDPFQHPQRRELRRIAVAPSDGLSRDVCGAGAGR